MTPDYLLSKVGDPPEVVVHQVKNKDRLWLEQEADLVELDRPQVSALMVLFQRFLEGV